jgi:hypothetical protein
MYLPSNFASIGLKFGLVHKKSTCESSSLVINKAKIGFNKHLNVHNRDIHGLVINGADSSRASHRTWRVSFQSNTI